jgi:A/G-specific adenine glycosylase
MIRDLLAWYDGAKRDLPWRRTLDPYRIWVSEVMCQQTRVETVLPYYERWMAAFPTLNDLAAADRQEVLRLWEGLGYYTRARNLHDAAKEVLARHHGRVPSDPETFRALKGVGPYTAAAVMSIAFGHPMAVLDGNVMRVVTRHRGIADDIRRPKTRDSLHAVAQDWLDPRRPGDFNQAMMELGARVCTPRNPSCGSCPLSADCVAFQSGTPDAFPVKSPAAKVPHHRIVVAILADSSGRVLITKRPETAMLGGLWEFPGGKVEPGETDEAALAREIREELGVGIGGMRPYHTLRHAYSHFKITLAAYIGTIMNGEPRPLSAADVRWVPKTDLPRYPFPKANRELTRKLTDGSA